jgi:hypothetical protein
MDKKIAFGFGAPVSTALLWGEAMWGGAAVFTGTNSAIWGTRPFEGSQQGPPSSAIWGTRPMRAPQTHYFTENRP